MNRPLEISSSVGQGGANRPEDVTKVQRRLKDLGYDWMVVDGKSGPITAGIIRLFQSIIYGRQTIGGDGRVDPGFTTQRWLESYRAPRWMLLPAKGEGFVNTERGQGWDDHDYGTSWLDNTIRGAGTLYAQVHMARNGGAPLTINDASRPHGGDSRDHAGHETGLSADFRLPRHDGRAGSITFRDDLYDRAAMQAQLEALHAQKLVKRIFLNDPVMIDLGLCKSVRGHDDHGHCEIDVPER